ncbi:TPA: hypothetical protein OOF41_000944 [Citrobacter freundii]|nr:hypothetical protein [Citrobacter freundii]
MRDIGRMGENVFEYNCNSVGLVANGSKIDKTGWDFFVEFPLESSGIRNFDQVKTPLSCRVQVKATDNRDKKISIKMSNLLTLAKSHTPAFIYFIEFDNTISPQNSYLVHLDSKLIDNILQKARKLSVTDCNPKLNKKTMTIHYNKDHHKLKDTTGESLKTALINSIGEDYDTYVKNKIKHLKKTGYEDGAASISFKLDSEENLQNLIESTLGGREKIRVSDFSVTETRFGIKSSTPTIFHNSGTISFGDIAPLTEGKISFHESKFASPLVFKCKLYNSPFNFCVPKENIKLKIESDFFTITIGIFSGKAKYSFSFDSLTMPLYNFKDAFKLMELICSGNKKIIATTNFDNVPELSLNINCNNSNVNLKNNISAVGDMLYIAEKFHIPKETETTIDYIIQKNKELKQLVQLMQAKASDINLGFTLDTDTTNIDNSPLCVIYSYEDFVLERWITYVVSLEGTAHIDQDGKVKLMVTDKRTEKELSLLNKLSAEDFKELMDEVCQSHQNKKIVII